jgi:hypothetical protein
VAKQGQTIASDLVHGDSGICPGIFVVFEPVCLLLHRHLIIKTGAGIWTILMIDLIFWFCEKALWNLFSGVWFAWRRKGGQKGEIPSLYPAYISWCRLPKGGDVPLGLCCIVTNMQWSQTNMLQCFRSQFRIFELDNKGSTRFTFRYHSMKSPV